MKKIKQKKKIKKKKSIIKKMKIKIVIKTTKKRKKI